MKFYTLIKIATNEATGDTVTVGALCYDGDTAHLHLSESSQKLAARHLANKDLDLKFILLQVQKKINEVNEVKSHLFHDDKSKYTQPDFYQYLNRYANGILQFSEPKELLSENLDVGKLFGYLFKNDFETKAEILHSTEVFPNAVIHDKLIRRVSKRIHTQYKFDKSKFENLYFNYELDCIGRNGSLIGAKSYDFNKTYATIDKDISHYFALIGSLSMKYKIDSQQNDFYLLTEEPSSSDKLTKELYATLVKNPIIKVLNPEQSDIVAERVEEKNATVFLD